MKATLVRFYVFPHEQAEARYRLVCQLAEKALEQGQRLFILCADEAMYQALDALLWAYPPQAFLPHALAESGEADAAPIHLGIAPARASACDVFINLSLEAQADIPRGCARLFEIVIQTPDVLAATRARYQQYRQRELPVDTHKFSV